MIVCAIDDLMFSVKISTAAKQLKADVYFERTADRVVETIRQKQPALVIFDLNSARMRPLEAVAALKADPELKAIRTLATCRILARILAAARTSGVDESLRRSASDAAWPDPDEV